MSVITNARYVTHSANDGDSFHVALNGSTQAVRLYFVDAPETSASALTLRRVREQMRYFGHSNAAETITFGHRAAASVRHTLRAPFTVHTSFASALGSTDGGRIYAFVTTAHGDDLGALLVRRGLARARGVGRETPDGISREEYSARLQDMELMAAMTRAGAWVATDPERLVALRAAEREEARELGLIYSDIKTNQPRININTASRNELTQLKGIGEKRADAIIGARPFKTQSDIFRVPGLPRTVANDVLSLVEF